MLRPPVGGRRKEKYLPLLLLGSGTLIGGLCLGAILAPVSVLFASTPSTLNGLLVGSCALAVAAILKPGIQRWLPERACQVPGGRILAHSRGEASFRWGLELGLGFRTFLVTPAFYAFVATILAQGSALLVLILSGVYGVARGGAIALVALTSEDHEEERGHSVGHVKTRLHPVLIAVLGATIVAALR